MNDETQVDKDGNGSISLSEYFGIFEEHGIVVNKTETNRFPFITELRQTHCYVWNFVMQLWTFEYVPKSSFYEHHLKMLCTSHPTSRFPSNPTVLHPSVDGLLDEDSLTHYHVDKLHYPKDLSSISGWSGWQGTMEILRRRASSKSWSLQTSSWRLSTKTRMES